MTTLRRIASGTAASAVSVGLLALAQIASVPLLTSAWGLERYGVWVMLTTIPGYLALSDLGFASAATSKLTGQFAKNDRAQMKCTFQSVWLLNSALSLAVLVLAAAATWTVLPHFPSLYKERTVFLALTAYSALVMNARVWLGAFRATHNYALGTLLYDGWLPLEALVTLTVAHLGGDLVASAITMLCMRLLSSILMWVLLRYRLPWLGLGTDFASLDEIRRLASPALGALAIPGALSLNLQGSLLVAGFSISPVAAATLGAVRTVSRAAIQVVAIVNRATMPELAAAWALRRESLLKRIIAVNLGSVASILIPAAIVFAAFGTSIIRIWTHDVIHAEQTFISLMALALPIHGCWYFALNLLLASNQHTKVSLQLAVLAGVALIPAFILARLFGLNGVAAALLGSEIVSAFLVINSFRRAYYPQKNRTYP